MFNRILESNRLSGYKLLKNSLTSNNLSRKITTYKMSNYKYPEVRRDLSIVDDIHGTKASI